MNHLAENAVAGPSTTRSPRPHSIGAPITSSTHSPISPVFLPPPASIPPPPSYLRCTQDLLGRFQLHAAYDQYVSPFAVSHDAGSDTLNSAPGGALDKGKGKEREFLAASPGAVATPAPDGQDGDGDDDDGGGKGEKKKKNNYKHLIKGIPGKHSMKKDDFLTTIIQVPPKQHIRITPFDQRTQRDAFSVSLEGLKGWNPSALIQESAQAREDRKKRKELKRLAKAQALAIQTGVLPASGLPTTPTIASSQVNSRPPQQVPISTPIPANPAASLPPPPKQSAASTPRPITATTTPRPGSTVPRPGSTRPIQQQPPQPQPASRTNAPAPISAMSVGNGSTEPTVNGHGTGHINGNGGLQSRGIKREREDVGGGGQNRSGIGVSGVDGINGVTGGYGNGGGANSHVEPPKVIMAARAGMPGARPRPIKRQRMDMQGQALDVTAVQQQPTPQGV